MIKRIIRNCLKIRKDETIEDGLNRHYYKIKKILPHKNISLRQLDGYLDDLGVKSGDVLIVHAAWRALYMIDASPEDVVYLLIKKIGATGTLLMPCYGSDNHNFDVRKTKSTAGILSECLRLYHGSVRSVFPKFSMCAYGRDAESILSEHRFSEYQFDGHSPYSIATKRYNAKVLLMGMGVNPHKISVFHCASYDSKSNVAYYKNCYSRKDSSYVVSDVFEGMVQYIDRMPEYDNYKSKFKKLFKETPKEIVKKNGLVLVLFNAIDAYSVALDYCQKGGKIYKKK